MVSSEKHATELMDAPSSSLSLHAVAKEVGLLCLTRALTLTVSKLLQPKHTMYGFEWQDQRGVEGTGFVRALRSRLTSQLPSLLPRLYESVSASFDERLRSCPTQRGET